MTDVYVVTVGWIGANFPDRKSHSYTDSYWSSRKAALARAEELWAAPQYGLISPQVNSVFVMQQPLNRDCVFGEMIHSLSWPWLGRPKA